MPDAAGYGARCDRQGRIVVGSWLGFGANLYLLAGCADRDELWRAIAATAHLAEDGWTWLVPGVPEAPDDLAAAEAAAAYAARLRERLDNAGDPEAA